MKQGTQTTIQINGSTKLSVKFLGKGTWTTAYLDAESSKVLLNVRSGRGGNSGFRGTIDHSKEILSHVAGLHIPNVAYLDGEPENAWYISTYYEKLTAANAKAWKQYRALRAAVRKSTGGWDWLPKAESHKQYEKLLGVAQELKDNGFDTLAAAIEKLASMACDYDDWGFEVAPRNLGVDAFGNLVLVDCLIACS